MSRVFGQKSPEQQLAEFGQRLGFDPRLLEDNTRRLLLNTIADIDSGALVIEGNQSLFDVIQTRINPRNQYESATPTQFLAKTVVSSAALSMGMTMRITEGIVGPLLDASGHLPRNK